MWLWFNQVIYTISTCGCDDDGGGGGSGEEMKEQDSSTFWSPKEVLTYREPVYAQLSKGGFDGERGHSVCLDSQFDPDDDYIKNFDRLGWHSDSVAPVDAFSASAVEKLALESEQALSGTELTPREITHNLQRFNSAIRMTSDTEKKASYIKLYELRKFDHDEDNNDDREKARYAIDDARDKNLNPLDRIRHYQTAIRFTNNVSAKEEIRGEYRRYCFTLQRGGK